MWLFCTLEIGPGWILEACPLAWLSGLARRQRGERERDRPHTIKVSLDHISQAVSQPLGFVIGCVVEQQIVRVNNRWFSFAPPYLWWWWVESTARQSRGRCDWSTRSRPQPSSGRFYSFHTKPPRTLRNWEKKGKSSVYRCLFNTNWNCLFFVFVFEYFNQNWTIDDVSNLI